MDGHARDITVTSPSVPQRVTGCFVLGIIFLLLWVKATFSGVASILAPLLG